MNRDYFLEYYESLKEGDSQKSNALLIKALKVEKERLMNQGTASNEEICAILTLLSQLDDSQAA